MGFHRLFSIIWYIEEEGDVTSEEGPVGEFEHSTLLEHHSAAQREANAAASSLCGEKWHEEGRAIFSRDGLAIIPDKQIECPSLATR
jgi:hypothetical protein